MKENAVVEELWVRSRARYAEACQNNAFFPSSYFIADCCDTRNLSAFFAE
jgi:hypothetical protein